MFHLAKARCFCDEAHFNRDEAHLNRDEAHFNWP